MNKENNKQDFIVTTANGTRWGATGTSTANVRENFFGGSFGKGWVGMKIQSIERGKLFTDEEEQQLNREKDEERCR